MTTLLTLPSNPKTVETCRRIFRTVPYLLLAFLVLYELVAILTICGWHFIYSLDDPYIHLALADRISQGTYGINPGEPASPSSSPVWPFLLVPFARFSFFEYVPLVINVGLLFATLYVYTQVAKLALHSLPDPFAEAGAAWIALLLIPATNLVGLAFTGMEHSLQVLLCALIVLGIGILFQRGSPPAWLVPVMIAAPLVRYECLAVVGPAAAVLILRRQWKTAATGLGGALLGLILFSVFLRLQGLDWLPSSVIAKSQFGSSMVYHGSLFGSLLNHIRDNLRLAQGKALAVVGIFLGFASLFKFKGRLLAAFGAAAILLHLAAGQFAWWDRYEIYIIATTLLVIILLTGRWIAALVHRLPAVFVIVLLAFFALPSGIPYARNFLRTPLASANIYEQQYQMHRFAVDYLGEPVAVNDLGWVAFRNPDYVLDLWGLASPAALSARTQSNQPDWMEALARQHDVRLVMIYDTWLTHPSSWVRVARLSLGWPQASAGGDTVTFYVTDRSDREHVIALLDQFEPTLPRGVRMDIFH